MSENSTRNVITLTGQKRRSADELFNFLNQETRKEHELRNWLIFGFEVIAIIALMKYL